MESTLYYGNSWIRQLNSRTGQLADLVVSCFLKISKRCMTCVFFYTVWPMVPMPTCNSHSSQIGPYQVIRVIPPVNYVLQKSNNSSPFIIHVDKLKKCFSEPQQRSSLQCTTSDWNTTTPYLLMSGTSGIVVIRVSTDSFEQDPPDCFSVTETKNVLLFVWNAECLGTLSYANVWTKTVIVSLLYGVQKKRLGEQIVCPLVQHSFWGEIIVAISRPSMETV